MRVNSLRVGLQTGSSNTYYATWTFGQTQRSTTSVNTKAVGTVAIGQYVTIKPGATYYNGVAIPSSVMNDKWQVIEIKGDRAVINRNVSGTKTIMSPINVNYLVGPSSSKTTFTTTNSAPYPTLDYYEVTWKYYTGDGIWFTDSETTTEDTVSTYSPPDNARIIKACVKPVAKTREVNGVETPYWTGEVITYNYNVDYTPPAIPSIPTITLEGYSLTATIENISDAKTDQIEFQVLNGVNILTTGVANVITCRAIFKCTISAGGDYRVRCRAINFVSNKKYYSDWSEYSASVTAIPSTVNNIKICRAESSTSVYIEWEPVATAKSYDIEYTTNEDYFNTSSEQVTTITDVKNPYYLRPGLESGQRYYFRVRAVNEQGNSEWSTSSTVIIGTKPSAPTTWSTTTTCIAGENLVLYWTHNCEDASNQTKAEIELTIDNSTRVEKITTNQDKDDTNSTYSYIFDTSYKNGSEVLWRVRTAGITGEFGEWSIQRTVNIYSPPTISMLLTDKNGDEVETINSFPFHISGIIGPDSQKAIGLYISVISNEVYETFDFTGNSKIINIGDAIYSEYYTPDNNKFDVEFSANNIDLQNGISYTVVCNTSMDSGLTAESSLYFNVSWSEIEYEPDAEISFDPNTYSAYIRPFCIDVYDNIVTDVMLSVYRKNYDGTFTELIKNVDANNNISVTDPHPSLDYGRYRIVATSKSTGTINYYDPPGYPIQIKHVILQWNEQWSTFNTVTETDNQLDPTPYVGSTLILPYNIDVSNNSDIDVDLIEYIGRSHPVSYYGTQLGETATWSMVIPKNDKETLYAIRRLSKWTGDVYVREPSGSGYWANVSISYNQNHCELTIPITLNIKRVEGGV